MCIFCGREKNSTKKLSHKFMQGTALESNGMSNISQTFFKMLFFSEIEDNCSFLHRENVLQYIVLGLKCGFSEQLCYLLH